MITIKRGQMKDKGLEDIMEDIRELRDADFHVCPHAEWQSKGEPEKDESGEIIGKYDVECSCNKFDEVINKIELYSKNKS